MAKRDVLRRIDNVVAGGKNSVSIVAASGGGSGMEVHALAGAWHTGSVMDFPEYVAHVTNPDAHHNRASAGPGVTVDSSQIVSIRLDDAANHPGLELVSSKLRVGLGAGLFADGKNIGLGQPASISAMSTNSVVSGGRGSYADNGHAHAVTAFADAITYPGHLLKTDAQGDASIRELTTNRVIGPNDLALEAAGMITFPQRKIVRSTDSVPAYQFSPAFPIKGWQINPVTGSPGTSALTIGSIQADELFVRVLVANETRVDRGEFYISKSYGFVSEPFVTPNVGSSTRIYFDDSPAFGTGQIFGNNHWIMFQIYDDSGTGLVVTKVWGQVSAYQDEDPDRKNQQSFLFTTRSGPGGYTIGKGAFAVGWGASGQAIIKFSAVDIAGAPYMKLSRWQTVVDDGVSYGPYAAVTHTDLVHVGDLGASSVAHQGDYGIVLSANTTQTVEVSESGVYLTNANIISSDGTYRTVEILPTGSMKLGRNVLSALDTGFSFDAATGNIILGKPAGNKVKWDAANNKLTISAVIEILPDSNGFGSFTDANLDNVDDGVDYGRVKATIIKDGMIQVSTLAYSVKDVSLRGWNIGVDEIVGQYDGEDQVVLNTLGEVRAGGDDLPVSLAADGLGMARYETEVGTPIAGVESRAALAWWDDINDRTGAPLARIYGARSDAGTGGVPSLSIEVDPLNADVNSRPSIWLIGKGSQPTSISFNFIDVFVGIPGIVPSRNPTTRVESVAFSGQLTFKAHLLRDGNNANIDIGTASAPFRKLYANEIEAGTAADIGAAGNPFRTLYVQNIVATTTTGAAISGSIWQNDASDMYARSNSTSDRTLYVTNPGAGTMHLSVDGSIAVGGTVDGVDVSAFKTAFDAHTHTHASLAGIGANDHHNQQHALAGTDHTASGLTDGWVLRATGATTFAWQKLAHGDLSGLTTGDPHTQYALRARQVIGGAGMSGGGDLSADRTLNIGAGTLITVGADDVSLASGAAQYQVIVTGAGPSFTPAYTLLSDLAGSGLSFASGKFAVGAGAGITVAAGGSTVALTTPGGLSVASANSASGSHTHAIATSSAPGAAAAILATTAAGGLTLVQLTIPAAGNLYLDGTLDFGTDTITEDASYLQVAGSKPVRFGQNVGNANWTIFNAGGAEFRGDLTVVGAGAYAGTNVLAADPEDGTVYMPTVTVGTTSATATANVLFPGHAVLRAQRSAYLLLDSDNNATGEVFVIARNGASPALATELFRFTETGRLGVGVDPGYAVDVAGSVNASTSLVAPLVTTATGDLALASASTNITMGGGITFSTRDNIGLAPDIQFGSNGLVAAENNLYIAVNSNSTGADSSWGLIVRKRAPTVTAGDGGTDFFIVRSDGRVGVNNMAPTYELDVTGSGRVTNTIYTTSVDATGNVFADGKVQTPLIDTESGNLTLDPAGGVVIVDTTLRTRTVDSASGQHLTVSPALDLLLQPGSGMVKLQTGAALQSHNYASQTTGMRVTNAGEGDFRYLYTDELHAKAFIADLEQALAGGQIISKSVTLLAAAFTVPAAGGAATLIVKDLPSAPGMAVFQDGDVIRLRQFSRAGGGLSITDCWGVVTGYLDGTGASTNGGDGNQAWTFTRSAAPNAGAMAAGAVLQPDLIILDYGTDGNGYYEVNAIDGLYAANSPYLQFVRWTGHPATGKSVRLRAGQLKGIFNQDEFGLFAGTGVANTDRYLRLSDYAAGNGINNLPFRLRNNGEDSIVFESWNNVWMGPNSSSKVFEFTGTALKLQSALLIGNGFGFSTDALLYCSFDAGDPRYAGSGDATGHLGQPAVITGDIAYRPGKFGRAIDVASGYTNLVNNPSFEADAVGTATPSGWTAYSSEVSGGTAALTGTRSVVNAPSWDGARAYKLSKTAGDRADRWGAQISPAITVAAGTTYSVSCRVRLENVVEASGGALAYLYAQSGAGNIVNATTTVVGEWVQLALTITAQAATLSVLVWLYNCDTGTMYLDAVQVTATAAVQPFWAGTRAAANVRYDNLPVTWDKCTLMGWFRLADSASVYARNLRLLELRYNGTNRYTVYVATNNRLEAYTNAGGASATLSPTQTVTAREWHHVAIVVDGGAVTAYLDGGANPATIAGVTVAGVASGLASLYVGTWGDGAAEPANGMLDDVAVINRVLTASEVAQIASGSGPIRALAAPASLVLSSVGADGTQRSVNAHAGGIFASTSNAAGTIASFGLFNDDRAAWGGFDVDHVGTLAAGDLVLGHNRVGGAAIFYDQSAGSFGFYGGGEVTPQVEILNTGVIRAINADLSGKITATSGAIGGWAIAGGQISSANVVLTSGASAAITTGSGSNLAGLTTGALASDVVLWAGNTRALRAAAPFAVSLDGFLYAEDAEIAGKITATSGAIGGWAVAGGQISSANVLLTSGANAAITAGSGANLAGLTTGALASDVALWAGSAYAGRATAIFRVTLGGALYAENADIAGKITATSGEVGQWSIASNVLSSTNMRLVSGSGARVEVGTYTTANTAGISTGSTASSVILWAGSTYANRATAPFRVTLGGVMTATGVDIAGKITATTGDIGGWTIAASSISSTNIRLISGNASTARLEMGDGVTAAKTAGIGTDDGTGANPIFYAGNIHSGRHGAPYRVYPNGDTYISNLTASGTITASGGAVGGWAIGANYISSTNIRLYSGNAFVARIELGDGTAARTAGIRAGGNGTAGDTVFWAGSAQDNTGAAQFRVTLGGTLYATSAQFGSWLDATYGAPFQVDVTGAFVVPLDTFSSNRGYKFKYGSSIAAGMFGAYSTGTGNTSLSIINNMPNDTGGVVNGSAASTVTIAGTAGSGYQSLMQIKALRDAVAGETAVILISGGANDGIQYKASSHRFYGNTGAVAGINISNLLVASSYAASGNNFPARVPANGIYSQGAVAIGTPGVITSGYLLDVNGSALVRYSMTVQANFSVNGYWGENWRTDATWQGSSGNGVVPSGHQGFAFRKFGDTVFVRGSFSIDGIGEGETHVGTMPVGYRPSESVYLSCVTATGVTRIYINSSGEIRTLAKGANQLWYAVQGCYSV